MCLITGGRNANSICDIPRGVNRCGTRRLGCLGNSRANEGSATCLRDRRDRRVEPRRLREGISATEFKSGANREGTVQVLTEWLKTDREIAGATYDFLSKAINDDGNLPAKGFRLLIEDVKKPLKIDREVSFSEVADLSILREAQKELGIKGK